MEFLLALLLKFWIMIWGILTGSINSLPFFRRLLLRRALVSGFDGHNLTLSAGEVPFLLRQLVVLAPDTQMRWQIVFQRDALILSPFERRLVPIPERAASIIIEAELIELRKGRRAHLFRRISRNTPP
ncbi:hypothetical protein C7S18_20200 [Ahniella affigens]|uniref:Uncharacterized protein n=1 Tax=Ahniella affigens TaxID=2021234 RepID=A0A2P1PWX7_9GAMM|nr:hypothetical protein [Ahniella affigens]AVP99349.1 hypothetical protein C7S18_20200 [Ahniella affigens]